MWSSLSEQERSWQQKCRVFATEVIAPLAPEYDRANAFPSRVHEAAYAAGLVNIALPEALGGGGASQRLIVVGGDELAAACAPTAFTMGFNHGALRPLVAFGTPHQHGIVRELLATRQYASICMTEAGHSGSSLGELGTRAIKQGDRWSLSGNKCMIGNGCVSQLFVVLANAYVEGENRGPTFFAVPKGPGVHVGENPDKLGFRCLTTPTIDFDGVEVPDENRVGDIGGAETILIDALDYMRFGGGAVILGLITGALRDALSWVEQRRVFGGAPLSSKSHVQIQLGDIYGELLCLRALILDVADRLDRRMRCSTETAVLKLRASRLAERATSEVAQMFGWRGIHNDYTIQKRMRDARVTTLYEGTSEVQQLNLFGELRRAFHSTGSL